MSIVSMTCYIAPTTEIQNALPGYQSILLTPFSTPTPTNPHYLEGGLAPITTTLSPSPATQTVPVAFTLR